MHRLDSPGNNLQDQALVAAGLAAFRSMRAFGTLIVATCSS